jgi:hypothetical protein
MSNGSLAPTVLTTLATLAVLADITWHLSLAVDPVEATPGSKPARPRPQGTDYEHGIPVHPKSTPPAGLFSIWKYESVSWTLLEQCGQEGCDCGTPPAKPGAYEGEVIRKECPPPTTR